MKFLVNGEEKNIELREWRNGHWEADFLPDVEDSMIDGQEITAERYTEMVDYYESEIKAFLKGDHSEMFGDLEEQRAYHASDWTIGVFCD